MATEAEIKITLPGWVLLVLVAGMFMTSLTNVMLYTQRYENDKEFMAKVREIRDENARLRAQLGLK